MKELLQVVSEGPVVAETAQTGQMKRKGINFSALTAYSEEDEAAAYSIIQTFTEETKKSAARLQQALSDRDTEEIASVAHKLLPLFTLIDASEAVPLLKYLESCRGKADFSDEISQAASGALAIVSAVICQAENYLLSMKKVG